MKVRLLIGLIFLTKIIYGQKDTIIDNKICINTAPLALLDFMAGNSYRIGCEIKVYKNISVSLEGGKYFAYKAKGFFAPSEIDIKGFIFRPEVKIYLNKNKLTAGKFLAVEYLYKNVKFNYIDSLKYNNSPAYQKEYTIYKAINCITIKYGELKVIGKHFIFEWYAGVGIRISNGHSTLTDDESHHVLTGENRGDLIGDGQRAPTYVIPNLNFGIKVGYRIK